MTAPRGSRGSRGTSGGRAVGLLGLLSGPAGLPDGVPPGPGDRGRGQADDAGQDPRDRHQPADVVAGDGVGLDQRPDPDDAEEGEAHHQVADADRGAGRWAGRSCWCRSCCCPPRCGPGSRRTSRRRRWRSPGCRCPAEWRTSSLMPMPPRSRAEQLQVSAGRATSASTSTLTPAGRITSTRPTSDSRSIVLAVERGQVLHLAQVEDDLAARRCRGSAGTSAAVSGVRRMSPPSTSLGGGGAGQPQRARAGRRGSARRPGRRTRRPAASRRRRRRPAPGRPGRRSGRRPGRGCRARRRRARPAPA